MGVLLLGGCQTFSPRQQTSIGLEAVDHDATIAKLCEATDASPHKVYSYWYQSETGPKEVFYRCLMTSVDAMKDRTHLRHATIIIPDRSTVDAFGSIGL